MKTTRREATQARSEQARLPFELAEKIALLRSLWQRSSKRPRAAKLLLLLERIATLADCSARVEDLANLCYCSERTAQDTIVDARRLGLLTVEQHAASGSGPSRYLVQWDQAAAMLRGERVLHPGVQILHPGVQTPLLHPGVQNSCSRALLNSNSSSPPPKEEEEDFEFEKLKTSSSSLKGVMGAASDASEAASAPTWAQAVERLSAIGVADARWAIRQARANGLTPQTVLGLADFFQSQPGRWGLGALHYRIRAQLEGAAIDLHWPPPSPDWQRSKAREDAPNRRERERQLWRREQVEDGEPSARSLLDELRAIQPPKSEEARGDG